MYKLVNKKWNLKWNIQNTIESEDMYYIIALMIILIFLIYKIIQVPDIKIGLLDSNDDNNN